MIMDLTAEFVKTLNNTIPSVDVTNRKDIEDVEILRSRVAEVMRLLERSEEHVNALLSRVENSHSKRRDEVVYVRNNESLKAIVSPNVLKPEIGLVVKLENECGCFFDTFESFENLKGYFSVETEEELRKLDYSLGNICLEVLDHSYRSFEGFSCYFALYIPSGHVYIIDAIKFRDIIPQLRILTCEVKKVIHCQRCVERLVTDFGQIGCYQNFNIPESDLFIDWRIRPLSEAFASIVCQSMQEVVEKINNRIPLERHGMQLANEVEEFAEQFNLPSNLNVLAELLKLRTYLARNNDESSQYVMTDMQLYNLIINNPSNIEEFEHLFERMSSVLRLHAGDFLLVLKKRSKPFSLENLKNKQTSPETENESPIDGKYRQFGNDINYASNAEYEDESSFHISVE